MPQIRTKMNLQKSTKRTHVYGTDVDIVAVKTIYVQQEQLPAPPPKEMTVILEYGE